MKQNRLFKQTHLTFTNVSLILLFLLPLMNLKSQTSTNFSGKWKFDKTKSSPGGVHYNYPGTVIRQITQDSSAITFSDIYSQPGSEDWETANETYNLDGKEITEKSSLYINTKSAKWSQDNKDLTITNISKEISKEVPKEFLAADTYKLSDDGKILTIEKYSKNPIEGETKTLLVFNRD